MFWKKLIICSLLSLFVFTLTHCDQEKPQDVNIPGVNIARPHLFPYRFEDAHTIHGLYILNQYLKVYPDRKDAPMAHWLLARTSIDIMTYECTLRAMNDPHAGEVMKRILKALGKSQNKHSEILEEIKKHLQAVLDQPSLAQEAQDALILASLLEQDIPSYDNALKLLEISQHHTEMSFNAKVLMAVHALHVIEGLKTTPAMALPIYFSQNYPYPCPEAFRDYAQGDHSLQKCQFICPQAHEYLKHHPNDDLKQTLIQHCGQEHFGLHSEQGIRQLSRENTILVQSLLHMTRLYNQLRAFQKKSLLGPMLNDFLSEFRERLDHISILGQLALLGPRDGDLHLPIWPLQTSLYPDPWQTLLLTSKGIYLSIPIHFRVSRDQVYIPEVHLGYGYPGMSTMIFEAPFQPGLLQVKDRTFPELVTYLDILKQDREELKKLSGVAEPHRIISPDDPVIHTNLSMTRLLIDRDAPWSTVELLLSTLQRQNFHPFEVVVWSPSTHLPSSLMIETTDKVTDPQKVIDFSNPAWQVLFENKSCDCKAVSARISVKNDRDLHRIYIRPNSKMTWHQIVSVIAALKTYSPNFKDKEMILILSY